MYKKRPLVSIVTVNYNGKHLLKDCLGSLFKLNYPKDRLEIFMVDNCSQDGSIEFVKENYPRVNVIENNVNNYCMANNLAISKSKGEYAVLVNNDTRVDKNWLIELVKVISTDRKIGAVGSKILFEDGRIQSVGHLEFPYYYWGDKGILEEDSPQYNQIQEVQSVSNCSALYRRVALEGVGLFDEDFGMYMEDVDISFRLKNKKWKIYYVPSSIIYHRLHGTAQDIDEKKYFIEKNRLLFVAKNFPERLPEAIFGHGEILRLGPVYFNAIVLEVFRKLIKLYGPQKAKELFLRIDESIQKIEDYGKHCWRIESETKIAELNRLLSNKDEQLNATQTQSNALTQQINELRQQLGAKDEQLNATQTQSNALTQQINELRQQLGAKDEQLNQKQAEIVGQAQHVHNLFQQLGAKDSEITALNKEIVARSEQLQNAHKELAAEQGQVGELLIAIRVYEERMSKIKEQLASKETALNIKETEIANYLRHTNNLNAEIGIREEKLKAHVEALRMKDEQIRTKDALIEQKSREIAEIFSSDTYRFIVRPIVWPLFSFIKRVKKALKRFLNPMFILVNKTKPKETSVCVAQFYATQPIARYRQKNEYMAKLFNKSFKEEKILFIIDVWPYRDPSHPQRHYSGFAIDVLIRPMSAMNIKFIYDWENAGSFFVDGKEIALKHAWCGPKLDDDLYQLVARINKTEDEMLHCLTILQSLKR